MRSLFVIWLLALFVSCNDNKAEQSKVSAPPPPPPKYSFYPKANVYFDTVNKDYIFLGSDGRTWTSGKEIPAAMQSMMDKSVLLDTFSQPVWKDNQNHRLIYSAALYATPNDTIERKPPPPVVQKPADSVKKEKKGLAKFLDKIFGKKKKKGN
ncbi:MAG: hypothetical protein EON98_09010 [Chitinophagaceae bacterium]|nr:MAG: hypothetical protein EON98_09010 [Chitinophagaceae bacterium]